MAIVLQPADSPTDTTPPATTPSDVVTGYMDLMADQDYRIEWREGTNSATHLTPKDLTDLYRLQKEKELDQARQSSGILRRIVD
jgi:hypothetical protein